MNWAKLVLRPHLALRAVPRSFFSGSTSHTLRVSRPVLDSLQTEFPVRLTKSPEAWAPLAHALVDSLLELWHTHLGCDLCSGEAMDSSRRSVGEGQTSSTVDPRSVCAPVSGPASSHVVHSRRPDPM